MYPLMDGVVLRAKLTRPWAFATEKQLAKLEVSMVFTLIILQIWIFSGRNRFPAYLAAAIIGAGWIARKENLNCLGLIDMKCSALAGLFVVGKLVIPKPQGDHGVAAGMLLVTLGYLGWALFQQGILNSFFAKRLLGAGLSKGMVPVYAGLIFGTVHSPNPILMFVTFLGGAASSYVFLRMERKNLYLIALAHAVLAVAMLYAIPHATHHLVVGPKFWEVK